MSTLKEIPAIIEIFKYKDRILVLILLLLFSSGTYVTTSYFNSHDYDKQEAKIEVLQNNIIKMQQYETSILEQNNKLILFIGELENMLIEKRNKEQLISKSSVVLNVSPHIVKSVFNDSLSPVMMSSMVKPEPIIINKIIKVNDVKFYDKMLNLIHDKLKENKKVKN